MIIRVMSDNKVFVIQDIGNNTEAEFIAKNSTLDLRTVLSVPAAEYGCLKLDGSDIVVDTEAETLAVNLANTEITNADHKAYLKETDWYVIRKTETGVEVPTDILTRRAEARAAII